jgi:small subunit ribosomal protein S16e
MYTAAIASAMNRRKRGRKTDNGHSGKGLIKVNGKPLHLVEPQILRFKVYEPVLLVGLDKFGMHAHISSHPQAQGRLEY